VTWNRISFLLKNVCQLESVSRSFLWGTVLYLTRLERETTYHYTRKNSVGIIVPNILCVFCCFLTTYRKNYLHKNLSDQLAGFIADLWILTMCFKSKVSER